MPVQTITVDSVVRSFTEVSRNGYDSRFLETTAAYDTSKKGALEFKHDVPLKTNQTARHLIVASENYTDPVTGKTVAVTAHCVIKVPAGVPGSIALDRVLHLGAICSDEVYVDRILLGLNTKS